jgi:TrpR-related protein YerC/YecD
MYESKMKTPETDALFRAILTLKNPEECYRFFEDICTINEIKSIAQRLQVAKMLRDGATFSAIAEDTGASTATISRVNRCLKYGADGYNIVLSRMDEEAG